ncbi:Alcohol dehydrogenase, zinc-binding protein [Candidatus Koribacter versatilis Ellin345]|uniref:Alcohol dehydrogenase, zinc-binding protein n=1 Tax=Koribacter versatilis (strain Ellin345) TaxID=204669 RepID=Q1IRY1_KORVE|nr:NADPH:quinone reductase [Candidatus Koribacter versatilis]ABF40369.1 Alcohol dehydrogenase, zinc-binding protein [Candidatus Koribacter versatilis Ellin345]
MKAIRVHEFGGPEVLKLEEVPEPKPGAHEVVVQIKAAGVNPVETYQRSGKYPSLPKLPWTPGNDGAGIVHSVGGDVKSVKAGDRVYLAGSSTGTYAEYSLSSESQVHLLPKNVSFAQGAAVGIPYGTAYRGLFQRAKSLPNEIVFINGASGAVGLAAVQLARAYGCLVIGTAGSDKGLSLVQEHGAHYAFNHSAEDLAQRVANICNLRGKQGPDVILEMLANKNLAKDMQMLGRHGRIVVIGNRGSIEVNPRDIMAKDGAILGMSLPTASDVEKSAIYSAIGSALEIGVAKPVVSKEYPLADAAKAQVDVIESSSHGKLVLVP